MAKIEFSTVINRPVEEVFAVVTNVENNPKWTSLFLEAKKTSEGPIGVGTTFRVVQRFLGQRLEGERKVIEYEQNRKYTSTGKAGPIPAETRLNFEPVEVGTRISTVLEIQPGGFFKVAEPLVMSMAKRSLEADFANLKDLMEAGAL